MVFRRPADTDRPAFDAVLLRVVVGYVEPVLLLDVRRGVEGDDDVHVASGAEERVYGEVVGHACVHESKVAGFEEILWGCGGHLVFKAQSEIGDRGGIDRMQFREFLTIVCDESVDAAEAGYALEYGADFFVVVCERGAECGAPDS